VVAFEFARSIELALALRASPTAPWKIDAALTAFPKLVQRLVTGFLCFVFTLHDQTPRLESVLMSPFSSIHPIWRRARTDARSC
jgi:hypothetical protein